MARVLYIGNGREHGEASIARIRLVRAGHEVIEAGSDAEALALAGTESVDCVVVNLHAPSLGGMALVRECRARFAGAPVVVVGSALTERTIAECKSLGLAGCVSRPCGADELVSAIERGLVSGRRAA